MKAFIQLFVHLFYSPNILAQTFSTITKPQRADHYSFPFAEFANIHLLQIVFNNQNSQHKFDF